MRNNHGSQLETFPGAWRAFISGEQRPNFEETKTILENRKHKKTIFRFLGTGEQANLFQENKGTGTPLGVPHPYRHEIPIVQQCL